MWLHVLKVADSPVHLQVLLAVREVTDVLFGLAGPGAFESAGSGWWDRIESSPIISTSDGWIGWR